MDDFTKKLNQLFDVAHPAGREPYTSSELVQIVRANGGRISLPYLSQLRSGRSFSPSYDVAANLAYAFGVSADYFSDPIYRARVMNAFRLPDYRITTGASADSLAVGN